MTRSRLRGLLMLALLVSTAFAVWAWFRPYEWNPDPAARCMVQGCEVRQDQSFYWLHLHLKVNPGEIHDLMKPARLLTSGGRRIEPADTTLAGSEEHGTTDVWLKFWLENEDVRHPLKLRINEGTLIVRSNSGPPSLGSSRQEHFTSHRW